MRAMKKSGIDWIGDIPNDWELMPMKAILTERKENNDPIKTDNILSLTIEQGVVPIAEKNSAGGNKPKEDLSKYRLAYPNDIVINSMNILAGAVGISAYLGIVSPVYYTLYPSSDDFTSKYYHDLFQTKPFQENLLGLGNGIMMKKSESSGKLNTIRMRIPMSKLGSLMLPVPSLAEQQKIATYLDQRVPLIDSIIEITKASIEDYKKYKQSLITETVTKGLNPDVKMKDSGIEWIGEIPEHWEVKKLKYLVDMNKDSLGETTDGEYEFEYVDIGSVTLENGIETTQHMKFSDSPSRARRIAKAGDVIISTVRTYLKAIAPINAEELIVSTGFAVLSPQNITQEFLEYACKCEPFVEFISANSVGISYPAINASQIMEIKIVLPGEQEQNEISDFLNKKIVAIDVLMKQKSQIVIELEAYKKSLIYEVVTGKKEIQ